MAVRPCAVVVELSSGEGYQLAAAAFAAEAEGVVHVAGELLHQAPNLQIPDPYLFRAHAIP